MVGLEVVTNSADHYLESVGDIGSVRQEIFDQYLRLWTQMLAQQLRAKAEVTTPPPRPDNWDSSLL